MIWCLHLLNELISFTVIDKKAFTEKEISERIKKENIVFTYILIITYRLYMTLVWPL